MSRLLKALQGGWRVFACGRMAERATPPWLASAIVVAIWMTAFLRPALDGKTVPWDAKNQFYAFFLFLARSIHDGSSILWNPYHYGGHPSIADPQSLIFSPPFLIWAALDASPSMLAFDLIVAAHLLAGALAMLAIGRLRRWPLEAKVVAAALFMLGGAASGRLQHTGIIVCYGLFPIALLTLELALERRSIGYALAFALTASCIILARNQVALMLCIALAGLGVAEVASAPRPLAYLRQRALVLAAIVGTGAGIVAVPLLLTLQLAGLSSRPSAPLDVALLASLHPSNLLSMAVANVFGALDASYDYWGPQGSVTPEVSATDDSFNYLFFGLVPVVLLTWHGVAAGRLLARGVRVWSAVLVAALLFSLGRYTPLFAFVYEHVPGFAFFRRPVDGMFLAGIALAMLTGELLSHYVARGCPRPRLPWVITASLATTAVIVAGLTVAAVTGHTIATLTAIARALPVLAVVVFVLWRARSTDQRHVASVLVAVIAVSELLVWNTASRLNAEPHQLYRALDQPHGEERVALDILKRELARRHLAGERPRVEIIGLGGAWQNLAMAHGIEATNGYNPLRIGLYDRLINPGEAAAYSDDRQFTRVFSGYGCALARALGIAYLVVDRPIGRLHELVRPRRVKVLLAGPHVWIYRFLRPMPRARFHSRIEVADADALSSSGTLSHPPNDVRTIIDDETPPARRLWLASTSAYGGARIVSWSAARVVVDVTAPTAGVLVLHDIYYPGWRATLDGRAVPVLRADTLFRGVEIPLGKHRVVFEFAPLSLDNLATAARRLLSPGMHAVPAPMPVDQRRRNRRAGFDTGQHRRAS